MSYKLNQAVLGNTAVKLVGKVAHHSKEAMSKEMNVSINAFDELGKGQFLLKTSSKPVPLFLQNSNALIVKRGKQGREWKKNSLYLRDVDAKTSVDNQRAQFGSPIPASHVYIRPRENVNNQE
jgi:hypothetical protein